MYMVPRYSTVQRINGCPGTARHTQSKFMVFMWQFFSKVKSFNNGDNPSSASGYGQVRLSVSQHELRLEPRMIFLSVVNTSPCFYMSLSHGRKDLVTGASYDPQTRPQTDIF